MADIFVLSQKEYDGAKNLPVILFNFFDKEIDLEPYEAIIFTSKNGVKAIDRLTSKWKDLKLFSIGSATTKALNDAGAKAFYTAKSSYGDNFANEIKEYLSGKKVLFVRPKVVTSNLNQILLDCGVKLSEIVLYETICNECKNLKKPPKNSKIIFSSPSTIECFFKCFEWDESYKAVVIGDKTASFMPKGIDFSLSKKQTIPSCIELASNL
jgi:uroporphyrinogen-III synthase